MLLQKETRCIKRGGWKLLNLKIKVNCTLFVFRETCKYLLLLPKGSNKWKKIIFLQNKKNLDIFILFKSFTPPALNASCFLLEHQWMFEPFLIVVFESLNCPQCEKMHLKIIQSLLERLCKRCWKTEDSAGHGGFVWRTVLSSTVQNKQGTHEQPSS